MKRTVPVIMSKRGYTFFKSNNKSTQIYVSGGRKINRGYASDRTYLLVAL